MRNKMRRLLVLVMVWGYLLGLAGPTRAEPRALAGSNPTGDARLGTLPTLLPVSPHADSTKAALPGPEGLPSASRPTPAIRAATPSTGVSPFIENRGQFDARAKFQWKGNGRTLWLTQEGIVFDTLRPKAGGPSPIAHEPLIPTLQPSVPGQAPHGVERLVFAEEFLGTHGAPAIEARQPLPGHYNYFIGNDPQHWRTDVPGYAEVVYHNVWDGIDLRLSRNDSDLEQEFVIKPGSDLAQVRVAFTGIDGLQVADDGSLVVHTAFGELRERPPRIYQEIEGQRVTVEGKFKLISNTVYTFEVSGYHEQYALVIDPTVLYSTFVGGTNSDQGNGVAVDSAGNAYVTGVTTSLDFPTTPGALQPGKPQASGCSSAFVTKLDNLGHAPVYSTYFGDACTSAYAIAVNVAGEAYVTGGDAGSNFPTTANAFQTGCSDRSFFLTKFNAQGNGLIYSTCLGSEPAGSYGTGAYGVALDSTGNAYLTGWGSGTNFLPTTPGAFQSQPSPSIGSIAFVAVLNPSASGVSSLLYATYFSGVSTNFGGDQGTGIAVDAFGMIYIAGQTSSPNFPVTVGAFLTTFLPGSCVGFVCNAEYNGGKLPTVFVAKLNPRASGAASLIYSTFLGGSAGAKGHGIAVDNAGNAYVTGCTACTGGDLGSVPFPTTPGAYQSVPTTATAADAFVTKLNAAGNGLVYSTLLGGVSMGTPPGALGTAIALDSTGDAYVTGYTRATNFPTTPDAFQGSYPGGGSNNAFVTKLNATGTALIYSSYLGGGTNEDFAYGITVDAVGDAYVVGYTGSADFPTTPSAFQAIYHGNGDTFVTKFPLGGQFRVLQLLPNSGGNAGTASITLYGTGLHNGLVLKLAGAGQSTIVATNVHVGPFGTIATATFDLQGAVSGLYDLVAINPDGASLTLPAAFTVQQGGAPDVRVSKVGTTPVAGRVATYTITLTNVGTVDDTDGTVTEFLDTPFSLLSVTPTTVADVESLRASHIIGWNVERLGLGPENARTFSYQVAVDPNTPGHSHVVGGPVCYKVNNSKIAACDLDYLKNCGGRRFVCEVGLVGGCLPPYGNLPACIVGVGYCTLDVREACDNAETKAENCIDSAVTVSPCDRDQREVFSAGDPNELVGPTGVGPQRRVSGREPLQYIISFSNESDATAPAQQVVVTNPIDPHFDLSTLQLTGITLVGIQVPIAPTFLPAAGLNEFVTNVDLRPTQNLFIQVDVTLDPTARVLTWTFTSIDPVTGQLPVDAGIGFLPPSAEGHVSFAVSPMKGLPTGTQITDQATIVFNGLAPQSTLPWTNTIAAPFVYVTNFTSNTVSVIDTASNTVIATIPVGSAPRGVAITPDGVFAYVANEDSSTVSVIDTASNIVVATIPVGPGPFGVAITLNGAFVYVASGSGTVAVIATGTNTVVATIPVGGTENGVAITPDGAFVYVTSYTSASVSVIATASNTVVATIPVGVSPAAVAITPDGAFVYVANVGSNTTSVIARASNTVVATIPVGANPEGVAMMPDGRRVYVTNFSSASVTVIDTAMNTVVATVPVGASPDGVAITPDGAFVYVANGDGTISVIATASNTVVATVTVGGFPFGVAILP